MGTDKEEGKFCCPTGQESCILCGRLTGALMNEPVRERKYYIEGAGQLCRECYRETYLPPGNENVVQLGELPWMGIQPGHGGKRWKA